MPFYAHSTEGDPSEWQPLEQHLENVARLAAEFAQPLGGEEWAWHAGRLRDFGKAYGLYVAHGFVSAHLAAQTGFSTA